MPGSPQIRAMGFLEVIHSGEVLMRWIFPRKLATSQTCCFPQGRNVLKTCSVLLFMSFFLLPILFWRVVGETNLKWNTSFWSVWPDQGNISFFWLDWFQINLGHASAFLRENAAPSLLLYCGSALGRTSVSRRQRATFVLAKSMGMVMIQGHGCTFQRAGRLKTALIIYNSSPELHEGEWERKKCSGVPCPTPLPAASLQQSTQGN